MATPCFSSRWAGLAVGLLGLATALGGCGGGDSYTPPVPITTTVDDFPMVVNTESGAIMRRGRQVDRTTGSLAGPEYGDTWMYQWINKTAGTGYYSTHYLSALDKNTQLYSHTVTFSDAQPLQVRDFGAKNQSLSTSFENTRCQDETQARSPFPRRPYAVGNTWTYVWSETCLNGTVATTTTKSITGRVVALETRTLGLLGAGGTALGGTTQKSFQTAKYTATRTETTQAGTWTFDDTCWHDMAQDRTVQCDTVARYTPAGSSTVTQSYEQSQTLAWVREVRSPSPVLASDGPFTVAQFAGRWAFKLVGTGGSVTCTNMAISLTGNVTGQCERVTVTQGVESRVVFAVSGFVDRRTLTTQAPGQAPYTRQIVAINVVADANPNDLSMTGEMLSPVMAEGTWLGGSTTGGTPLTGTFVARHL